MAKVKLLAQPMPRAPHADELGLILGLVCDMSKPKVIFGLSAKAKFH
jgi:hypothetical protein